MVLVAKDTVMGKKKDFTQIALDVVEKATGKKLSEKNESNKDSAEKKEQTSKKDTEESTKK